MTQTALVTGADRGLGQALVAGLCARGWRGFAGQYMPDWPELGQLAQQHPGRLHIVPLPMWPRSSPREQPPRRWLRSPTGLT